MDILKIITNQTNKMKVILDKIKATGKPVILYGAGNCGENYCDVLQEHQIEIKAFCDDDKDKIGKELKGIKIVSLEECQSYGGGYIFLVSSYGPGKLLKNLKDNGLDKYYIPTEFYLWEHGLDYYEYFLEHKKEIEEVWDWLSDDQSRKVMRNLLNYKITRDISLIDEINEGEELQYFDEQIMRMISDVKQSFVDLGAYTGDTVQRFQKNFPVYDKIFALEPDPNTFKTLQRNTANYKMVNCINKGAYNKKAVLRFQSEGFWTSTIDANGNISVDVDCLDDIIHEKVTFIKADIEGAEKEALAGMVNLIKTYRPTLAFCIYHRKEDIFEVARIVKAINPNYRLFMRHYSEIPVESVMYAVDVEG